MRRRGFGRRPRPSAPSKTAVAPELVIALTEQLSKAGGVQGASAALQTARAAASLTAKAPHATLPELLAACKGEVVAYGDSEAHDTSGKPGPGTVPTTGCPGVSLERCVLALRTWHQLHRVDVPRGAVSPGKSARPVKRQRVLPHKPKPTAPAMAPLASALTASAADASAAACDEAAYQSMQEQVSELEQQLVEVQQTLEHLRTIKACSSVVNVDVEETQGLLRRADVWRNGAQHILHAMLRMVRERSAQLSGFASDPENRCAEAASVKDMPGLLQMLGIDPASVRYSEEEEDFVSS